MAYARRVVAPRAKGKLSHLAALLAVGFLLLAGVRSTVMQAEMAAAPPGRAPLCMDMAGRHPGAPKPGAPKPGAPGKACAFCAVAGHLPVCGSSPAPAPPATVAWLSWRPAAGLGPRGPPAFAPRARGPPMSSLIA